MPRLDRERDALARLIADGDNAALAEMARIRLRAVDFVARHATPTAAAVDAAARRDDAGERITLALPQPSARAVGGHLVNVNAKLAKLDRLAELNDDRRELAAADRRAANASREATGNHYFLVYGSPPTAARSSENQRGRMRTVAVRVGVASILLALAIGGASAPTPGLASLFALAALAIIFVARACAD